MIPYIYPSMYVLHRLSRGRPGMTSSCVEDVDLRLSGHCLVLRL